jgi:hypothetical protein
VSVCPLILAFPLFSFSFFFKFFARACSLWLPPKQKQLSMLVLSFPASLIMAFSKEKRMKKKTYESFFLVLLLLGEREKKLFKKK